MIDILKLNKEQLVNLIPLISSSPTVLQKANCNGYSSYEDAIINNKRGLLNYILQLISGK